ncbi:FtsX-like permease family protein [Nocardia sp. CA-084685]|uniref:FtsX-like permease family protein n=1 Tax=Nocardia sp. CA-084685 TaxID=3239970 RepID=UPI003D997FB1
MSNRVLVRKIGRDLRRRAAQVAAIAVTVLLGVLLFVASYDSFRNLETSYRQTYERLHLADFTARGGDPAAIAAAVRDADGVARIVTRTQADVPMSIGGTELVGRITGDTAGIDEIELTAGSLPDPAHPDQVVVEHHAARTFDLTVGSRLRIFDGTDWRQVSVSGVARSAEYLWPARSRQDIIGDPHAFAVVFAPQAAALRLSGQPGPNQTLLEMSPTATPSERDRIIEVLRSAGAAAVEPRREQPSNAALHQDLNGFSEIAIGFPALFLIAAAIAEYVLITRLVQAERPIIGTLLAMGARRRTVVGHYVGYGVAVTGVGALLGVLSGFVVTSAVTAAYTRQIGIPDTVVEHRVATAVIGFALGLLTGVIAALVPAIAAARIAPAAAMRGDGDGPAPARWFARWDRLPVVVRMALRSLTRGRRRTFATMTGTVLALILILASVGMLTSMRAMLKVQFGQVQQEDATVLVAPGTADLLARLRAVSGVAVVEPGTMTPVTVAANGNSYSTRLTGLPPNTTMHGFRNPDGGSQQLPEDGVLAGAPLAEKLGVRLGDILTVTTPFGTAQQQRLAGFVDEPLGTSLYATNATAHALGGLGTTGYLLRFDPGGDRNALRTNITDLPGVIAYTDTHALENQVDKFLGLLWIFIAVMLILGATLAFTVIYVTMTVNLAERITELATLRAAGVSVRRLTAALAIENLTATLLAVPLGLTAGIATAWAFLRSFTSDMFDIDLVIGALPPLLAVAAVVTAAALSQLPAGRLIQRIDVARVVRERAQ